MKQNGLKVLDYRTITFGVVDKVSSTGKKISSKRLQNALWVVSVFLNRFLGKFILTKRCGGNLIVKARLT